MNDTMETVESKNKAMVLEAFDAVFNRREMDAFERFWSPDYIQHSGRIPAGREGLRSVVSSLPIDVGYEHDMIVAEGDLVCIHGRFSTKPTAWITADIVRIDNGSFVEHWHVIENEATQESSASGRPMFGKTFPIVHLGVRNERAGRAAE